MFKRAHTLFLDNAQTTTDLIQAESGKNRRMAIEETCDPPMVISHYLKRAPKLLAPNKRGGPVPFLSTSTEIRAAQGRRRDHRALELPVRHRPLRRHPGADGRQRRSCSSRTTRPRSRRSTASSCSRRPACRRACSRWSAARAPTSGPTLIDNANYVMFTGSTATGRVIGERAGRNLIGCCLELGGKNPMIVLDDANLDEVGPGRACSAPSATPARSACTSSGSTSPSRGTTSSRDAFVAAAEALKLGASYDFGPEIGSLVSPDHRDRVASHVEDAVAKGATVLTGGRARPDLGPAFFEPTMLEGVTKDMLAGDTETFGPVVALHRYRTVDEAVELANDTDYGLNASVWGGDIDARRGGRPADRVRQRQHQRHPGHGVRLQGHASGGVKQSGVGARHGDQGLLKYTDVQNVAVLKKQVMGAAARPGLRRVRQADARRPEDDAEDRASADVVLWQRARRSVLTRRPTWQR